VVEESGIGFQPVRAKERRMTGRIGFQPVRAKKNKKEKKTDRQDAYPTKKRTTGRMPIPH
jgi:hypothetical protein